MSNRPVPVRTCNYCGGQWTNAGHGRGGSHKTRYCSTACRDAARRAVNRSNRGNVPVGKRFVRADDLAECVVCQDARGLPYALALREEAYAQEVVGG